MPLKGEARRRHDKARDKRRRAAHRKAKAAGQCVPAQPHYAKPNAISPNITADNLTSPEVLEYVVAILSRGTPDALLRAALGLTAPAFAKLIDSSQEFKAAVEQGHAVAEQMLTDRLRDIALSDDRMAAPSAMFLLKTRHGYREKSEGARQPQIIVNLPAQPMSRDDYMRSLQDVTTRDALPAPEDDA